MTISLRSGGTTPKPEPVIPGPVDGGPDRAGADGPVWVQGRMPLDRYVEATKQHEENASKVGTRAGWTEALGAVALVAALATGSAIAAKAGHANLSGGLGIAAIVTGIAGVVVPTPLLVHDHFRDKALETDRPKLELPKRSMLDAISEPGAVSVIDDQLRIGRIVGENTVGDPDAPSAELTTGSIPRQAESYEDARRHALASVQDQTHAGNVTPYAILRTSDGTYWTAPVTVGTIPPIRGTQLVVQRTDETLVGLVTATSEYVAGP